MGTEHWFLDVHNKGLSHKDICSSNYWKGGDINGCKIIKSKYGVVESKFTVSQNQRMKSQTKTVSGTKVYSEQPAMGKE